MQLTNNQRPQQGRTNTKTCTSAVGVLCEVDVGDIDSSDRRFQFRLNEAPTDLIESVKTHGQQVPVTLWDTKPYVIIDGFRRVHAARALDLRTVKAIIRSDLDEQGAFAVSFIENAKRRNFGPLDKAHAIRIAIHQHQLQLEMVAEQLQLSPRQVRRYLQILNFDQPLAEALDCQRISMGHAVVLHRASPENVCAAIHEVQTEKLSVDELRKRLNTRRGGRPRSYVVQQGAGFRMNSFSFKRSLPEREKRRILHALQLAIVAVKDSLDA